MCILINRFELRISKQDPGTTSRFPSFVKTVSIAMTRGVIALILRNDLYQITGSSL